MRAVLPAIAILIGGGCATTPPGPVTETGAHGVYLTWQQDPTTTMTVQWLSRGESDENAISWTPRDGNAWQRIDGVRHPFPHSDRFVHTVELIGLVPGADYQFRIEGDRRVYAFRTMPADASEPITFVAGGDLYKETHDDRMYIEAAARDPMFALIGGDIAYDNGEPSRVDRWFFLLDVWDRLMVTSDGRLIPLVVAIGNHEVLGRYEQTSEKAPFFYSLFEWPGARGYNILDFGDYMSVIALDSVHTNPIHGEQTEWLERMLTVRADTPHVFVTYHIPAFPSVRKFDGKYPKQIRRYWVPLFEKYGVDVVYEAHEHAYKRTPLIRDGKASPDGVLYLGDGAWGANVRGVHPPEDTWYLERAESVHHVIVTTIHGYARRHEALNEDGEVFDVFPED